MTLISSTSTFFTLVLAAFFPSSNGDRFTLSKLVAVSFCIIGVIMITVDDVNEAKLSKGVILALLSAFFYASYLVLVKHKSDTEEKIDIPLFFGNFFYPSFFISTILFVDIYTIYILVVGFVGLWNLLLMWPVFFVLNFTQIEIFEFPNQRQFLVLFLNGLIGTVLSEALWLWSCFLTSSLIGTIGITLQIPFALLFDVFFKHKTFSDMFYIGSIPIFLSLIFVGLLMKYDDCDPIMMILKMLIRKICNCRRTNIVR